MILRGKARAEDLAGDENISSGSDDVIEITQSQTEEPSDNRVPAASPLEDTAFGSVEDVPKPVSLSLVQIFKGC
jgi:hypothetical protein